MTFRNVGDIQAALRQLLKEGPVIGLGMVTGLGADGSQGGEVGVQLGEGGGELLEGLVELHVAGLQRLRASGYGAFFL